jgi:hypothetical protein
MYCERCKHSFDWRRAEKVQPVRRSDPKPELSSGTNNSTGEVSTNNEVEMKFPDDDTPTDGTTQSVPADGAVVGVNNEEQNPNINPWDNVEYDDDNVELPLKSIQCEMDMIASGSVDTNAQQL